MRKDLLTVIEKDPHLHHRNRVTANLEGGWLDARLPKGSSETVEFNINQLTSA